MVKKNKKVKKVAVFTLLVLCGILLTNFNKTYSRFYDKEDNALVYKGGLYNLYYGYPMEIASGTKDNVKFTLKFKRNKASLEDNQDIYEIIIPDSCQFDSIQTQGNHPEIDKTSHSHKITFSKNVGKDYTNRINISCSVDSNSDKIEYIAKIIETIGNEKFTYIEYSYEKSYKDYIDQISKEQSSDPVTVEGIYNSLLNWIKEYTATHGYYDQVLQYIQSVYKDANSLVDESSFTKLPGFRIEPNDDKTEYTFKILSNFIGYARTYASMNINKGGDYVYLYFSTTSMLELNDLFNNYLKWYVYPNDESANQLIYDYIFDNGGISAIISGDKKLTGLSLQSDGGIRMNKTLLLSMATSNKEGTPHIALSTSSSMKTIFSTLLTTYYADLSLDIQRGIYSMILNSITKNSTDTTTEEKRFKDYFTYNSGNSMFFVKVSSEKPGYNTFSIEQVPFDIPDGMTITSTNKSESEFTITIKHTTETSVTEIVTKLSEYFETPIDDNNLKVISNTADEYSVEYTITK